MAHIRRSHRSERKYSDRSGTQFPAGENECVIHPKNGTDLATKIAVEIMHGAKHITPTCYMLHKCTKPNDVAELRPAVFLFHYVWVFPFLSKIIRKSVSRQNPKELIALCVHSDAALTTSNATTVFPRNRMIHAIGLGAMLTIYAFITKPAIWFFYRELAVRDIFSADSSSNG